MVASPTGPQLKNGAQAIAYRGQQLAGVAALIHSRLLLRVVDAWVRTTIGNALIESALVNARALAWFFTKKSNRNVNVSLFLPKWNDDIVTVAEEVVGPVSQHLGHATIGSEEGEEHPGEWPIPELAVVLVGGLSRFVHALDRGSESYEVG